MPKFEFSDFYKFLASMGIVLLSIAALVPWLFLREPFDLFKTTNDIAQLSPLAQEIIADRQTTIQIIFTIIPVFSITSFFLGLAGLIIGSVMWYQKTQLFIDKLAELNIKALERKLGVTSKQLIKTQHQQEIKAQLESEFFDDLGHEPNLELEFESKFEKRNINKMVENAINIEKRVTELVFSCFNDSYSILSERHLGPIELDIIMASKTSKPDYIFEVKYIRKGFHYSWLRDNTQKIVYAKYAYQEETKRVAIPVLFIVSQDSIKPSPKEVENYIFRVKNELASMDNFVLILFFTETDFDSLDCNKLKRILNI